MVNEWPGMLSKALQITPGERTDGLIGFVIPFAQNF
jgi:hypothetical protein